MSLALIARSKERSLERVRSARVVSISPDVGV